MSFSAIHVNTRAAVYCSAIREGNMTDFDFLWGEYTKQDVSTEQNTILVALGCARDADTIKVFIAK